MILLWTGKLKCEQLNEFMPPLNGLRQKICVPLVSYVFKDTNKFIRVYRVVINSWGDEIEGNNFPNNEMDIYERDLRRLESWRGYS